MPALDAFRNELRAWLEQSVPKSQHGLPMLMQIDDEAKEPAEIRAGRARYLQVMAERGYTAPTWPKEYGGAGLSGAEALVLQEELARLRLAPPLMGMGLWMIGPTLLVHGSEALKREFLPKIVTGEHRWCQGFSEPGAGSDLASLRCSAKLDPSGERYVINGSKIWTSGAQFANWMFMLVRTDESSKHNGITFLLVDMKTPGIEVKPIQLIAGTSMFCEVFLTDVVAEARHVVGNVNQGWTVAKTLLNFERSGMGGGSMGGAARRQAAMSSTKIAALAKETVGERDGKLADGLLRDQLAQLMLDELALTLTIQRSSELRKATGAPGPEISMFKLYQSELGQRRDELLVALRGTQALGWEGASFSNEDLLLTRSWLSMKATTIYGGTSEIQRNIIAKRVLKLPTTA
jgi:alkylation response protein AidB-like acyl-CoA dehydrogenase